MTDEPLARTCRDCAELLYNCRCEDYRKAVAEREALDKAYRDAAEFDARNAPKEADPEAESEADYYAELERGYRKDRI